LTAVSIVLNTGIGVDLLAGYGTFEPTVVFVLATYFVPVALGYAMLSGRFRSAFDVLTLRPYLQSRSYARSTLAFLLLVGVTQGLVFVAARLVQFDESLFFWDVWEQLATLLLFTGEPWGRCPCSASPSSCSSCTWLRSRPRDARGPLSPTRRRSPRELPLGAVTIGRWTTS
jgi:hypothetical protein